MDTFWKISDAAFKENSESSTGSDGKRRSNSVDHSANSALTRRFSSDWKNHA